MIINFKMPGGERLSWDVTDPDDRIDGAGFMERIYYLHGVEPDAQRFIFKGRSLNHSLTSVSTASKTVLRFMYSI